MKGYKDLSEIKGGCRKVTSCCSGSDGFMYMCFPFICERLESIDNSLKNLVSNIKKQAIKEAVNNLLKDLK